MSGAHCIKDAAGLCALAKARYWRCTTEPVICHLQAAEQLESALRVQNAKKDAAKGKP